MGMSLPRRFATAAGVIFRGAMSFDRWLSTVATSQARGGPSEPYNQVVPVRVCVQYIAQTIGAIPFRISTPDDQIIENGPLARLATRPNPEQTIGEMWAMCAACYKLFGRYHLFIQGSTVNDLTVQSINPLQMTARLGSDQQLLGWTYKPLGTGSEIDLELDEVHTVVDPNYYEPQKDWEGISPAQAAGLAIAQYYKSDLANESSLDNDVQPSGAVTTDRHLTYAQERGLLKQIESEHAGSRKRRRIMVLQGGLKWQQMAANFAEMEFMAGRAFSREDICASFGLKAIMFFGQSGSGLNDDQARSAAVTAHQSVVRPLARAMAEQFTCAVLSRLKSDRSLVLKDGMRRDWSRRSMTAGQTRCGLYQRVRDVGMADNAIATAWFDDTGEAVTTELWQQQSAGAKTWFDMGVPLNDILDATDAPFENRPHGDIPRIPAGLIDARQEGAGEPGHDDPTGLPDGITLEDEESAEGNAASQRGLAGTREAGVTEDQLVALWRMLRMQSEAVEKTMVGPYRTHLMTLRAEVLANLRRLDPGNPEIDRTGDARDLPLHWIDVSGDAPIAREAVVRLSKQQRDLLGELVFSVKAATAGRWKVLGKFVREGIRAGGEQSMREAAAAEGKDTPSVFNIADPGVGAAMRERNTAIGGLTIDQAQRLRVTFAQGLSDGETTEQLIARAKEQFGIEARRAKLVAFQESGSAVEAGRQLGREQAGVPLKSWLSSRKETARPAHAATERATLGQPIPVGQDFVIAGTNITCPHPRATGYAEQDINCGCTTISRYPGDGVRGLAALRTLGHHHTPKTSETTTP